MNELLGPGDSHNGFMVEMGEVELLQKPKGSSRRYDKPTCEFIRSPNMSARQTKLSQIVLHYTTSDNLNGTISWFQNPKSQVSAHYVVGRDGRLVQMVKDGDKAWHCYGQNDNSIGIEISAKKGQKMTSIQEDKLIELLNYLCTEYKLTGYNITAHRFTETNIGGTDCPGDLWKTEAELNSWIRKKILQEEAKTIEKPEKENQQQVLQFGDVGAIVEELHKCLVALKKLGPGDHGRHFTYVTKQAVKWFQKENGLTVDGVVGLETAKALDFQVSLKSENITKPTQIKNPLPVPYFSQRDYGGAQAWSICGCTSVAMVLKFYGIDKDPNDVLAANGKASCQSPDGCANVYRKNGLSSHSTTTGTYSEIKSHLDQGRPVVIHGYFTSSGHIMVIVGYTDTHWICNDPAGEWEEYVGDFYGDNLRNGKMVKYSKKSMTVACKSDGNVWYSTAWRK